MSYTNERPDFDKLLLELDDPDPEVRQDAAAALGDHCRKDHPAVDVLIERLRSGNQTFHDRACAVWALGQIGARAAELVPAMLAVIDETRDQADADELRHYAADAIEMLTGEVEPLVSTAQLCLRDRSWKCKMNGLFLAERLFKRQPELRDEFVPLIEPLLKDEVEEIRENARRIVIEFAEGV